MRISVITASLNQGEFIERTIQSVLRQKGPFELEYIIIDGGSSDGTLEIVKKYQSRITWISGKDVGQSDAINKGLEMASGEILAWLNSDDTYEPGALSDVVEVFRQCHFEWCIGKFRIIDEHDKEIRKAIAGYKILKCKTYTYKRLLAKNFIPQPAVLFTRKVYKEIGPLCLDCHYTMDYDYWLRIGRKYKPRYIDRFLANFRWHKKSKCGEMYKEGAYEAYLMAKKHATPADRFSLVQNYLHYLTLSVLYTAYDALPRKSSI